MSQPVLEPSVVGGSPQRFTRSQWGAKPRRGSARGMSPELDRVFVHWPAVGGVVSDPALLMRRIQQWHFGRNFTDIGYSWGIGGEANNGFVPLWEGRGLRTVGGHTSSENNDSYGVCFLVGMDQAITPEMWRTFVWLCEYIRRTHNPSKPSRIKVMGHTHDKLTDGRGTSTSCPGPVLSELAWDYNHDRDMHKWIDPSTFDTSPPKPQTNPNPKDTAMTTPYTLPGNRRPVVEELQRTLKEGGYYDGRIDADPYHATLAAVKAAVRDAKKVRTPNPNQAHIDTIRAALTDEVIKRELGTLIEDLRPDEDN